MVWTLDGIRLLRSLYRPAADCGRGICEDTGEDGVGDATKLARRRGEGAAAAMSRGRMDEYVMNGAHLLYYTQTLVGVRMLTEHAMIKLGDEESCRSLGVVTQVL